MEISIVILGIAIALLDLCVLFGCAHAVRLEKRIEKLEHKDD